MGGDQIRTMHGAYSVESAHQCDEVVNFLASDMLFHQLAVVVHEVGDRVFSFQIITNLTLHERKVAGNQLWTWLSVNSRQCRTNLLVLSVVRCEVPNQSVA